ncbi:DUF4249 domain-containing protein [uncultured Draconibacterium sp.]|uniref:DUF4249 domain-containing protein n=1 Tax=uncultured Draconibacterium sp. TaxID=1573823 RepID=UPI003216E4AB
MKRLLLYCFLLAGFLSGCEDIYQPEIDSVEGTIVADARIVCGQDTNYVYLYNSIGFYESDGENTGISGATVKLVDDNNNEFEFRELGEGNYRMTTDIDPNSTYKLVIEKSGKTYESDFEPVPKVPSLDTVYGIPEVLIVQEGGENNVNNFKEVKGIRLYADITTNAEMPYFKFTARKILQYTYGVDTVIMGVPTVLTMYGWRTFYPQGSFNVAAPPEYSGSVEIKKHPLFFLNNWLVIGDDQSCGGWNLILYQHGISESSYNFYNDLNSQLDSDGKLFDPLYVQARNNLKCTSNENELILGNFEISRITETRYFVRFISEKEGYAFHPVYEFYDIPFKGEILDEVPEFWHFY